MLLTSALTRIEWHGAINIINSLYTHYLYNKYCNKTQMNLGSFNLQTFSLNNSSIVTGNNNKAMHSSYSISLYFLLVILIRKTNIYTNTSFI